MLPPAGAASDVVVPKIEAPPAGASKIEPPVDFGGDPPAAGAASLKFSFELKI